MKKKILLLTLLSALLLSLLTLVACDGHLIHDYQPVSEVKASCTRDGYTLYRCSVCTAEEKRDEVPAGHTPGSIVGTVAPTCTEDGYTLCRCKICGEEMRLDPKEKTGHTPGGTDEIAPTCKDVGYRLSVCLTCGEELEREEIPAGRHVPGEPVKVSATCTTDGYVRETCTICGELVRDEKIEAYGHVPGTAERTEPTCSHDGSIIKKCTVCHEVAEYETIPALPHTPLPTTAVCATCTEDGVQRYVCSVCFERLPDEKLPATGHSPVSVAEQAPTCTEDGATAGKRCQKCKLIFEGLETIPALGHNYTDTAQTTVYGHSYDLAHCKTCGDEYRHNLTVDYTKIRSYQYFKEHYEHGEGMANLYAAFYEAAENFLHSTADLAAAKEGEEYQSIKRFTIDCSYSGCKYHTNYGLTIEEAASVWSAFTHDNPQFFFLYNGYTYGDSTDLHLSGLKTTKYITLCVSADYYSYETRKAILDGMDAQCHAVSQAMKGKEGVGDRAKVIHDYVIFSFDYQYIPGTKDAQTAKWAHNIVGLALGLGGVCECYEKCYLYFSYLFDINSIPVYGGNHAWNMTEADGEWYGLDLTWDDKGGSSIVYTYFGATEAVMSKGHTPYSDDFGIGYQVPVPTCYYHSWTVTTEEVIVPPGRKAA